MNPKLPGYFYSWMDPPDDNGEEALNFVSTRRRMRLKGHGFREFQQYVAPMLDGNHTLHEIEEEASNSFGAQEIRDAIELLMKHKLIVDAEQEAYFNYGPEITPQLNFFNEMGFNQDTQALLANSSVAIIGLSGAGTHAALSLAAARVGTIKCVDMLPVAPTDTYLSPLFKSGDIGRMRVEAIVDRIRETVPTINLVQHMEPFKTEQDLQSLIHGSDYVVCCLDAGQASLLYKLNRVCLRERIRWTSCMLWGAEIIVGPTIHPFESACYLCYKMRASACAENPEAEFVFERYLDRRRNDDSGIRENLVFSAGIAAHLLGLETLKGLAGGISQSLISKICVLNLIDLNWSKHTILKEPFCPACSAGAELQPRGNASTFR